MKKTYQLTAAGREKLEQELEELKSRRGLIAQQIADARDNGDLSENSEWDEARNLQGLVESRIAEIEEILMNASVITAKNNGKVEVGNTVVLNGQADRKVSYTIVGSVEADPLEGRISDESPIGKALLGKKVGDAVAIQTPKGEVTYKIEAIELGDEKLEAPKAA